MTHLEDERFIRVGDRTALIAKTDGNDYGTEYETTGVQPNEEVKPWKCLNCIWRFFPSWFPEEFTVVFNLSWSLFIISLFNFLLSPISLIFVGHLGTDELAGVAMAATVLNVTGISIAAGLTTACDTVFSQSMGSLNKSMMGVYLVKSFLVILLFVFPCWALHLNVERLLLSMGQDAIISRIAGDYLIAFMPGIPFVFIVNILMKYLRCQDIIMPTMVIGAVGCALNALLHWIFLWELHLGTDGSAYAMALSFMVMAVQLIVYIWVTKIHLRTWKGWSMDILQDWGMFTELAVAGMLMIGLEWGAYEVGIITSGFLSSVALGATSLVFQVIVIVYMVPMGIGLACNIRVGQHLGANDVISAKRTIKVGLGICLVCATVICATMGLLRYEIPKMFSNDPEVISYSASLLPIAGLVEFFDGFAGVYGGILRGCGRQVIGTAVMILGFYVLGLPIGLPIMFYTSLEVPGLYIGLCVGVAVEAFLFVGIVQTTNWDDMLIKAQRVTGTVDMDLADPETGRMRAKSEIRPMSHRSALGSRHLDGSRTSLSRLSIPSEMLKQAPQRPDSARVLVMKRSLFVLFMLLIFILGLYLNMSLVPIEHPGHNVSTTAVAMSTIYPSDI